MVYTINFPEDGLRQILVFTNESETLPFLKFNFYFNYENDDVFPDKLETIAYFNRTANNTNTVKVLEYFLYNSPNIYHSLQDIENKLMEMGIQ